MPVTFSWTDSFMASYFLKMRLKVGMTFLAKRKMARRTKGMMAKKISDILALMDKAMIEEKITIIGVLTAILKHIWNVIWILETSDVIRVTNDEVENLSISPKLKS